MQPGGGFPLERESPFIFKECAIMRGSYSDKNGKSRGGGGKPLPKQFGEFRFANIEFTTQEREDFKLQLHAGDFESFSVSHWLEQGYKVSFSLGNGGDTCICSISCKASDHPNAGLIISGRGRDPATALGAVSYKISVLCADGLWREGAERRGGFADDVG